MLLFLNSSVFFVLFFTDSESDDDDEGLEDLSDMSDDDDDASDGEGDSGQCFHAVYDTAQLFAGIFSVGVTFACEGEGC